MSRFNQMLTLPVVMAAVPMRFPLWRRIAIWLRSGWQSECRRAERPDRVVPYY